MAVIKQHDTYPPLRGLASDSAGAVDLSGADELKAILKGQTALIEGIAVAIWPVETDNDGNEYNWEYEWEAGDTDVADTYASELEVTWNAAATPPQVETFPNHGTASLTIEADQAWAPVTPLSPPVEEIVQPADLLYTAGELAAHLNREVDDDVTFAAMAATDVLRRLTGQVLTHQVDDVVTIDGSGTDQLILSEMPVTSVKKVVENDETLVLGTDVKLKFSGILVRLPVPARWTKYRLGVTVTYSHGWDPVPDDLRLLAKRIAVKELTQGPGVVFESLGQHSVRYGGDAMDFSTTEKLLIRKHTYMCRS